MRHYTLLSPGEFRALYAELRDPEQIALPSGGAAFQVARHPLYGRVATVHDGERIALLAERDATSPLPPGHLNGAMKDGGPAWASLVALGGMMAETGL